MSLATMRYVRCDGCGNPAGGTDDMRDSARAARHRARQLGYKRISVAIGGTVDLCPACQADPNIIPTAYR